MEKSRRRDTTGENGHEIQMFHFHWLLIMCFSAPSAVALLGKSRGVLLCLLQALTTFERKTVSGLF